MDNENIKAWLSDRHLDLIHHQTVNDNDLMSLRCLGKDQGFFVDYLLQDLQQIQSDCEALDSLYVMVSDYADDWDKDSVCIYLSSLSKMHSEISREYDQFCQEYRSLLDVIEISG